MSETKHSFNRNNEEDHFDDDEDWSESSYSSCSYSDSDSTIPDWDSSVDERTGEVLYIECHPYVTQNFRDDKNEQNKVFSRNQTRQSTRGKFLRLLRRRESKRTSKRNLRSQENEHNNTKVKFQDFQEGEEREVMLKLENKNVQKGSNNVENLLGIHTSTLSDGIRLMVAGFSQNSNAKYEKNIKIGDWLKSINGIEVNCQNLNSVLQQLSTKCEVLIKLQRVAGVDVTKDPPINILNNQSAFVKQLTSFSPEEDEKFQETLCTFPVGFLCLSTEELGEMSTEYQDVIYSYPRPIQKNMLGNSKGIFITLNHLLQEITKTSVKVTSLYHKRTLCHVAYKNIEGILILLMLPHVSVKLLEIEAILNQILKMFEFTYNTLNECFKNENIQQIDHVFTMFFAKFLNNKCLTGDLKLPDDVSGIQICEYEFEDILPAVQTVDLPNEAAVQVEDALNELEACDYREWNDEPLDCQRIFTMLGSVWYHSGYLISSHLMHEDLKDIHYYCKYQGILHLSVTEPVKTLVIWREVFPTSCRALSSEIYKIPEARRYLLIVGSQKDLLAVLMESGGCTEPPEENAPPDPFYVEEAQATLAHLQELGISELADRFISMNPGPQVTIPQNNKKKIDGNTLFSKSPQGGGQYFNFSTAKKQEVTSILKRRNNDQTPQLISTEDSTSYDLRSEGSGSQCNSERSERNYDSNSEDSENDEITTDGSQMSTNSFDISELKQMLLTETEDIQPVQITSGAENVLYHYLQFDKLEGILIAPPECKVESATRKLIISNFRMCSQKIHKIFENTIRFKDMSSHEMAKSVMNKSLIAIKEHGALFECPILDEKDSKRTKISYWVIGRLFFHPHVREMYVCYNDSIPQNIIEMAFKLNMGFCD